MYITKTEYKILTTQMQNYTKYATNNPNTKRELLFLNFKLLIKFLKLLAICIQKKKVKYTKK